MTIPTSLIIEGLSKTPGGNMKLMRRLIFPIEGKWLQNEDLTWIVVLFAVEEKVLI